MFIDFDGIINARDMGGYVMPDGRKLKKGLIYRTGGLEKAGQEDLRRLREEFNVSIIFDMRGEADASKGPDRIPEGARYLNYPVLPPSFGKREKTDTPPDFIMLFNEIYRLIATEERAQTAYRAFFAALLEGKGILFHCHQGKDRTGIGAYLLLTALGADEKTAREDYLLTNDYMEGYLKRRIPEKNVFDDQTLRDLFLVNENYLDRFIEYTAERYGSVYESLYGRYGLTDSDIALLRELYTE